MDSEIKIQDEIDIEKAYDLKRYDISSYPADYTISTIMEKYNKTIIVPDFQRKYVWSKDAQKQSRLIESFYLGLPVPQIFLFQKKESKELLIIDGFQRLNTIHRFVNNDLILEGVTKELQNRKYKDFSEAEKEEFDNLTFRAIIIRQLSPDDDHTSMFHIFERLNTGGMTLSPMEIRKAILFGEFFQAIEKLNNNEHWKKIINRKTTEYRLRDIEWLLRIIALSQKANKYEPPMKDFLTKFMAANRHNDFQKETKTIEAIFKTIFETLGPKPFHFPKSRLNLSVLDSSLSILIKKGTPQNLKTKFQNLYKDKDYLEIISVRDATRDAIVKNRIDIVDKYLK